MAAVANAWRSAARTDTGKVRARNEDDRLLNIIERRLDVSVDDQEIGKLYWERARVLRKKGDLDGALCALENVTMLEPDHVGALALSGEICISKGAFAEAAPRLVGKDTGVVFAQNGIPWWYGIGLSAGRPRPPELRDMGLKSILRKEQIIGCVVYTANEVVEPIAPRDGEPVIPKTFPSAFFGTDLLSYLVYANADTIILTGMVTSGCVRSTAIDAFSYNYRVIIPEECVADRGQTSHKVALFDLHMKYADVVPKADTIRYLELLAPPEAGRRAAPARST